MGNEVQYGTLWVRREGNQILIEEFVSRGGHRFSPDLILVLTEDGGLAFDPEWKAKTEARLEHAHNWSELLSKMNLGYTLFRRLDRASPPQFIAKPTEMIQYLCAIANGEIKVEEMGKANRTLLYQALQLTFPEEMP